ncbi:MAG TPA: hypothetical protein PL154_03910, partial [Candidatus Woesebacteria bacterium]|nr:hypothetical protein [Candidatus Woesebacteria bacterium]
YRMAGTDYGQYFIDSAGMSGQLWSSDGSGRGTWVDSSSVGTDDQTLAEVLASGNNAGTYSIDMNNQLITNIGAAGTDFTSGGGLNLASNLDVTGSVHTTNQITFNNISVSSSNQLYKSSDELFFKQFNLTKALNKSVTSDPATAQKYYDLYQISMGSSMQGVFDISILVQGSGYGQDYEYRLPVSYVMDWLNNGYGMTVVGDTWYNLTPSVFTGRHLLIDQNNLRLQAKVSGNTLYLRIYQPNVMSGSPIYKITVKHSNEFRDAAITELNTTGTDANSYNTIPAYIAAKSGSTIIMNNLGLGTATPSQKLDITGNMRLTGAFYDGSNSAGSSGQVITSTGTGTSWTDVSTLSVGNADTLDNLDSLQFLRSDTSDQYTSGTLTFNSGTIADIASGATLDVNGNVSIADTDITLDGASTNLNVTGNFSVNSNDLFIQKSNGSVGIGTTAPSYKLDVAGDINTTTGTYRMAGIDYGQYFIDSAGTNNQVW